MKCLLILTAACFLFSCSGKKNNSNAETGEKNTWTMLDDSTAKRKCIEKLIGDDYSSDEANEICSCMVEKENKIFASYEQMKKKDRSKIQEKQWEAAAKDCGLEDDEDDQEQ